MNIILCNLNERRRSIVIASALACLLLAPEEVLGWCNNWRTGSTVLRRRASGVLDFRIPVRSWQRTTIVRFDNIGNGEIVPPQQVSSQAQQPAQTQPSKPQKRSGGYMGADQLNQIKEDVDMVAMIESYDLNQFRRTGTNRATALCPFHDDRNPSLGIDGSRGLYKCFSCGAAGDIFNFVRQYHKEEQGEELPFMQAVRHVHDFCSGSPGGSPAVLDTTISTAGSSSLSRMTEEEQKELAAKRDRIYTMNQQAAAFYANGLTQPFAGGARYYLRSRGFESAATARAFALGYAPDVYFGRGNLPGDQTSLVVHLKDRGYNASEILESGLAIQKRTKAEKDASNMKLSNTTSVANQSQVRDEIDFASLMDRFRGRLMVPILDRTGKKVLGFGGRILPRPDDDDNDASQNSDFKAPKYLNSPETAVFQKKNLLFGHHIVMEEYQRSKTSSARSSKKSSPGIKDPLLIVEGYMDVLALWDAGIKTAVASMGTAISMEQVNAAAKIASPNGGRVVLCLDNDDAGNAAVERMCSGQFLMNAASSFGVQFLVASLPIGVKDPGEFIEGRRDKGIALNQSVDEFRNEVIGPAEDWSDWFLARILDRYDDNAARAAAGSFGDVFQRVADFLATFSNPAERTKSAYEIAGKLANIMAIDNKSTTISKAARMQLESDLIDSASRIANAKESMKRRVEMVNGGSPAETRSLLSAISKGGTSMDEADAIGKLSRKALRNLSPSKTNRVGDKPSRPMNGSSGRNSFGAAEMRTRPRRRMYRPLTEKKEAPSLTPHFAGFEFENQSDADWLGVPRNKAKRGLSTLTIGSPQYVDGPISEYMKDKIKPIYFNSNDYHGDRFLSNEAMNAGYSDSKIPVSDHSLIMEQGVGTMVREDVENTLQAAENSLLQNLVHHYPESRNAVRDVLHASSSVGPEVSIEWSSPTRKWLFQRLVEEDVAGQDDGVMCDPASLRLVLSTREDVPSRAFSESANVESANTTDSGSGHGEEEDRSLTSDRATDGTVGSLDDYFTSELSHPESLPMPNNDTVALFVQREKASLAAQEHLMTLLSTSAAKQLNIIQQDMREVSLFLHARSSASPSELQATDLKQEDLSSSDTKNSSEVMASSASPSKEDSLFETTESTNSSSSPGLAAQSLPEQSVPSHILSRFESMSMDDVKLHYDDLLGELQGAIERRNKLDKSAKRITERLMRFSSSTSSETVEGRISVPLQKRIAQNVDEFMVQLETKSIPVISSDIDENDRFGSRDDEDGTIEDQLADIERSWGDWCEPDYVWSPSEGGAVRNNGINMQQPLADIGKDDDEEDNETLEEALERIDNDWSKWGDDDD